MSSRRSFVFSTEADKSLDRLQIICRLANASQVIRLAVICLEDLVDVVMKGGSITFHDATGKAYRKYHPLLETEAEVNEVAQVAAGAETNAATKTAGSQTPTMEPV